MNWARIKCAVMGHEWLTLAATGYAQPPARCLRCDECDPGITCAPMPQIKPPAEPTAERVQIITAKAGDTIAISVDQHITKEQAVQIKAACNLAIPGVAVVVLSRGMSLTHIAAPHATGGYIPPTPHPADAMGFDAWMRERTKQAHAAYMARHAIGGRDYDMIPMSINASAYMRRTNTRKHTLEEVCKWFGVRLPVR